MSDRKLPWVGGGGAGLGIPVLKRLPAGKQTEDVRQDCALEGCSGVVLICGGVAEKNSSALMHERHTDVCIASIAFKDFSMFI